MIDATALGQLAANAMDQMEERFPGDEGVIRSACLVVEVDTGRLEYLHAATEDRPYVLIAFLQEYVHRLEVLRDKMEEQEEEEREDEG